MVDYTKYYKCGMADTSDHVIKITQEHNEVLKRLKPMVDSSKSSPVKLEFSKEQNEYMLMDYGVNIFNEIYIALEFFVKFCVFDDDFIEKYNVKNHHIKLIRKLKFDMLPGSITINESKPFGRENIGGDIAEQMDDFPGWLDGKWYKNNMKNFDIIFNETIDIFIKAIQEINFIGGFEVDGNDWVVSKSYLRDRKIDKLLSTI